MEAIWEKLSQPLPRSGSDPEPIVTPELRQNLIALLDRYDFEYLAEGRANVVFSIEDPDESDGPSAAAASSSSSSSSSSSQPPPPPPLPRGQFRGTLLRVPKATPGVTPCDYATLQRFHEEAVERRVGRERVVPQVLVSIAPALADRLNAARRHNGSRNGEGGVIRAGAAMLVQDMGPSPSHPLALEFKPKWLAQSPLAPPDAVRCRSCAREALRNAQKMAAAIKAAIKAEAEAEAEAEREEVSPPPPPVCRLRLMHKSTAVFRAAVDQIAAPFGWSERDRGRLAAALRRSGVLERIRDLQVGGDPGSTLFDRPSDPDFGLAMTLRDCSCFVRMSAADDDDDDDDGRGVIIKLADVDKKNWEEKQTYWQKSHQKLVEGGWYAGMEDPPVETDCLLSSGLANGE